MAVLQMQRISICGLKKDRKAILEKIQSLGIMEMNQIAGDEEGFEKMDTMNARQSFERSAQTAEQALAVLDIYAPQKKSLLSSLEGKELVERKKFDEAVSEKAKVISTANQLLAKSKEIAEAKAGIAKLENQIEALMPWLALDVPMNYSGTKKTALFIGTVAADMSLESIYAELAQIEPEPVGVDIQVIHSDRDAVYLTVLCLRAEMEKVEGALRTCGFARPSQVIDKVPASHKASLEAEITQLNTQIEKKEKEIMSSA